MEVAVNGTLMNGLELNSNLTRVGARFLREARTAPAYRLWSIDDVYPAMQRVDTGGVEIQLEVWDVPAAGVVELLMLEPEGLCIGKVLLSDGITALGILAEAVLCNDQFEITEHQGWRNYIASSSS